jgi:hypothetical protein
MKTIPPLSDSKAGRVLFTIFAIVFPAIFSFVFAIFAAFFLAFVVSPYLSGVALILWLVGNVYNCYRLWAKRAEFIPISYLMNDGYLYVHEKSAKNGGRERLICDLSQVSPAIESYEAPGSESFDGPKRFRIILHILNEKIETGFDERKRENLQRDFDEIVHEIELAKKLTANSESPIVP